MSDHCVASNQDRKCDEVSQGRFHARHATPSTSQVHKYGVPTEHFYKESYRLWTSRWTACQETNAALEAAGTIRRYKALLIRIYCFQVGVITVSTVKQSVIQSRSPFRHICEQGSSGDARVDTEASVVPGRASRGEPAPDTSQWSCRLRFVLASRMSRCQRMAGLGRDCI